MKNLNSFMPKPKRILAAAAMIAALYASGYIMIEIAGSYGLTLFVASPICLGAISAWLTRPNTWQKSMLIGSTGAFLATLTFA